MHQTNSENTIKEIALLIYQIILSIEFYFIDYS